MDERILNETYDMLWKIFEMARENKKTGVLINLETLNNILNKFDDGMGR